MNELKRFIYDELIPYGCNMEWNPPNERDLDSLIKLATEAKEQLKTSDKDVQVMRGLLYELKCLVEHPHKDWEEKYDGCWLIKDRMCEIARIEWYVYDTNYEENILAFYYAAKYFIENKY